MATRASGKDPDGARSKQRRAQGEDAGFATLVEQLPALIQMADPDGRFIYFNQRWLEYIGADLDDVTGWNWTDLIHPDDRESAVADWQRAFSAGIATEHRSRVRRADGEYRWFLHRNVPVRDGEGHIVKWCGASIDIDDQVKAEEQVRRDSDEVRQIIDLAPQHVFVTSAEGKPKYWNAAALEYLGLTLEESLHDDVSRRIIHPDDLEQVQQHNKGGFERAEAFEFEARIRRADGEYRWFLIRGNPLRDEKGNLLHWYRTATDIDERKLAESVIRNENIALREEIDKSFMFEEVIGTSRSIHSVLRRVSKVAKTNSTVLLTGETGTGKELIARAIHKNSERRDRAFVSVNCAAIPQSLIASELFGHEKGAFTGAAQRKLGRFELAHEGTIFLDEVGDLPMETQVALLRVLQEREIERVGGRGTVAVNVRVIAATNRDLDAAIDSGEFRNDLYYRLNVFPIEIPALRERKEDIPLLVDYFIERYARASGRKFAPPSRKTLDLLTAYSWPGNVRELQNVIQRSMIVCDTDTFEVDENWLISRKSQRTAGDASLGSALTRQEISMIEDALTESRGRVAGRQGAASRLGLPVSTLESRIKALNIDKYRFRTPS